MHSGQARKARYGHVFLVFALASASWPGCAAPRPYRADTTLVTRLGHEGAETRLRTLLRRTESSPALDVHVTDEHIELIWLDTRTTTTWRFSHIESIDIGRGNHMVTVRVRHGLQPYHIDFTTADDATTFVDLLMSFYQAGASAEVALPRLTREQERP
jgi:hypothetical protein